MLNVEWIINRKATVQTSEKLTEIADLAESIALHRFPDGRAEPENLLDALKITCSFGRYRQAFDGMLEHINGKFHVYGNLDRLERRDSPRARFTLGHELGHYYIDDHRHALEAGQVPSHASKCEYESTNPVEREADHFASNLLMPARRFQAQAKRAGAGLKAVLTMSSFFGTSITATCVRYVTLDVAPCAIIKWTQAGYAWKWLSPSAFAAGMRKTIESVPMIPKGSPTARAMVNEKAPAAGFFEAGTTASVWFPFVGQATDRNVIMIEQAITLGRFGILTFLYPQSGSFSR